MKALDLIYRKRQCYKVATEKVLKAWNPNIFEHPRCPICLHPQTTRLSGEGQSPRHQCWRCNRIFNVADYYHACDCAVPGEDLRCKQDCSNLRIFMFLVEKQLHSLEFLSDEELQQMLDSDT